MELSVTRRTFLGSAAMGAVAGSHLLKRSPILASAADEWPTMRPTRIYKVYVGRTGDIYLSRPTDEIRRFDEHLNAVGEQLGNVEFVGGEQVPATDVSQILPKIREADGVLLFHLSGHGGDAPKKAMDQIVELGIPTAVFSQPFSGHGWMYFPEWRKAGKKVVLLPTSDWSELDRVSSLMRVPNLLSQTKVLVVRGPQGTPASCDAEAVRTRLGVEMIPISVEETLAAHDAVSLTDAEAEAEEYWIRPAKKIVEPTRDEIVNSARFYLALRSLMKEHGAQAVTSSNCMADPAKGCLAFSKLNDIGLVGACEGDMDSTLTMLMFQYGFGVPGFITDPVVDVARNALIHFHCTSATRMGGRCADRLPFSIRTQTDSGRGVALDVENEIGRMVTCAKLVNLDAMLFSTGKIIDVTHDSLGCRTQFVTEVADAKRIFNGWGADQIQGGVMALLHRVVFYGDHKQGVEDLGSFLGYELIQEG